MTLVEPTLPAADRRLSLRLADRITGDVVAGGMAPGELIGHEPDLMQRYGVSRGTLREAIRQIEARGVAEMRRGISGGLVVTGTPVSIAADTLATYLEVSDITLGEQFEVRFALEELAAGLAATRCSLDDIAAMRAAVASWRGIDDAAAAREPHFALRRHIARASGNPVLFFATSAIFQVTQDVSVLLTGAADQVRHYLDGQIATKSALVEAIAAGDVCGARALIRSERERVLAAEAIAPHLATPLPDLVLMAGDRSPPREERKLGMTTALRLRRSIAAMGWPVGEHLGTEEQLRLRLGVSRGLVREALMLLEVHGVVRLMRGRVGGILVGRPDPEAAIDAVLKLFRSVNLADNHLGEICAALDLLMIEAAMRGGDAAGLAGLNEPAALDYPGLRATLRDLSGNRVLAIVSDILRSIDPAASRPPAQAGSRATMEPLLHALAARDSAIAQRMLRRIWQLA